MPKYHIVAERKFTIDYEIEVDADTEEHARVIVEQHNNDLEAWEDTFDCALEWGHEFNEYTPKVFEIKEL